MRKSNKVEIARARLFRGEGGMFTSLEKDGVLVPQPFIEPVGFYTRDRRALYTGKDYYVYLPVKGINLNDTDNDYEVIISGGRVLEPLTYNQDKLMLVFKVRTPDPLTCTFNGDTTIPSTWQNMNIVIKINGISLTIEDYPSYDVPIAYLPRASDRTGANYWESNDWFIPVLPNETMIIESVTPGGGGSGVALIRSEVETGGTGSPLALFMLEPSGPKHLFVMEGGYGGEVTKGAFLEDEVKLPKVVYEDFIHIQQENTNIKITNIVHDLYPIQSGVGNVEGGMGYCVYGDSKVYGRGGAGAMVSNVGFRGIPGSDGRKVETIIEYEDLYNLPVGPLLLINPRINLFKQGYLPLLGMRLMDTINEPGEGGYSPVLSGKSGTEGIVSLRYKQRG